MALWKCITKLPGPQPSFPGTSGDLNRVDVASRLACSLFAWGIVAAVCAEATAAPGLSYVFRYDTDRPHRLHVEMAFDAEGGSTQLRLPDEWSAHNQLYRFIRDLHSEQPGISVVRGDDPARFVVKHPEDADHVTVRYDIAADPAPDTLNIADYGRPLIERRWFYLLGRNALVVPDVEETRCFDTAFSFAGLPGDWSVFTGLGRGRSIELRATIVDLLSSGFWGGDFRRLDTAQSAATLTTRGEWRFDIKALTVFLDRAVEESTRICGRGLGRPLLVVVLPTDEEPGNFGGSGQTGSVNVRISGNVERWEQFAQLLAHELFHSWNPGLLGYVEDERLYWFTEGFTEFYSHEIMRRTGTWSFADTVEAYNLLARRYYTSPARNIGADEMIVRRRVQYDAQKLPYQQGYLIAANWNAAIKRESGGARSLDNAMHALYREARELEFVLSNEAIAAALEASGVPGASDEIDRVVARGQSVVPDEATFGDAAVLEWVDVFVFDPGFDMDKLEFGAPAPPIRPGSAAHRAGMREGQIVVTGGIARKPDYEAHFVLQDGEERSEIRFYPRAEKPVRAPRFAPGTVGH